MLMVTIAVVRREFLETPGVLCVPDGTSVLIGTGHLYGNFFRIRQDDDAFSGFGISSGVSTEL